MIFQPKFISFDCYGTLINFEMGPAAQHLFKDRVPADRMPAFLDSFRAYHIGIEKFSSRIVLRQRSGKRSHPLGLIAAAKSGAGFR